MAERLTFDIFAIDNASRGFIAAGRAAQATSDDVAKLARRLDDIGTKSASARVGLKGDKESLAQLDQLQFRLLKLGEKTSKPNVSLEGFARATAEISALSVQMDRLNDKTKGTGGLLSRLLGSGPGGGGLLGKLFPAGAAGGGPGLGLGLGLVAAVPAVEALLVELTGVASGLAAATLGLGAFGILSYKTISGLSGALSSLSTVTADMKNYQATIHGLEPDLQNAARLLTNQHAVWQNLPLSMQKSVIALHDNSAAYKALLPDQKTALNALLAQQVAWNNLSPAQQRLSTGLHNLGTEFTTLSNALAPVTFKVFNAGLKIATELLPALLPLATAGGNALAGLADHLAKFFKLNTDTTKWEGSGRSLHAVTVQTLTPFGEFVKKMTDLAGPSITAIGIGFGHVAISLGKLLTVMGKKDVVNAINIAFSIINGTILALIWVVSHIMHSWDQLTSAFDHSRKIFDAVRAWIEKNFVQVLVRFFTSTLPTAFDLWKESVRLVFDVIKIKALDTVLGVTVAFGHLPGPLGAPFRAASASIRGDLAKIQGDAANAATNINADWDKLHGKKVTLAWQIAGPSGNIGSAPPHAAGGMIRGGVPGRDSVLISAMPGEVVVPVHMVAAGLVDHLRGALPGFAAGGTVGRFTGQFPSAGQIGADFGAIQNVFNGAFAAWAKKAQGAMPVVPGGIAGPGGGNPLTNAMLAISLYHPSAAQFAAWNYVAMRESGWNQFARNPSSGAYGIAQALPESKYPFAGTAAGGSNPTAQITWMWNYMAGRYGGPAGAAAHEAAFNWYDGGGTLLPGLSLNTTGRKESVLGSRAEALLEQLVGLVDELCGLQAAGNEIGAAAPSRTGAGLGAALGMGARSAQYRALYP